MDWIESGGGPLSLIPIELLALWGGVQRSSIGTQNTDYDRACQVNGELAVLRVDDGSALVLGDEPLTTAWRVSEAGGCLLRWVYGSSEADLLSGVPEAEAQKFPGAPHVEFVTGPSGECVLIDAADPGDQPLGPHLTIRLVPGRYTVDTVLVDVDPENRLLGHRLRPLCANAS